MPAQKIEFPGSQGAVEEACSGKFTNLIKTATHAIYADHPRSVGGNDRGLSPYELVSASLGASISMTLRMYAELKKLPLDQVRVEVQHDKMHATDCADCETRDGKIDRLKRLPPDGIRCPASAARHPPPASPDAVLP